MSDFSLNGVHVQVGEGRPVKMLFVARGAANGPLLPIGLGIAAFAVAIAAAIVSASGCRESVLRRGRKPSTRRNRS